MVGVREDAEITEIFLTLDMGLEIPESPWVTEERSRRDPGGVKKGGDFCGEVERSKCLGRAPGGEKRGGGFCGEVESSRLELRSEPLSMDIC